MRLDLINKIKSQGCIDAEFCTIGTLKAQQYFGTTYINNFKLTYRYGEGEQDVTIFKLKQNLNFGILD